MQALVTDATSEVLAGSQAERLIRWLAPTAEARLQARAIPSDISRNAVHTFLWPSLQIALLNRLGPEHAKSARFTNRFGLGGNWLGRRAIEADFFGADTLYVHPCVCTEAVVEAKRRGKTVIVEAISHPFNKRIESQEQRTFGQAEDQSQELIEDNIRYFRDEALLADMILAASAYVKQGLLELGLPEERVRVVPYGLDERFFSGASPRPVPGVVLYVGAVNLLKGVQYLAAASRILEKIEGIRFNVVGPSNPDFQRIEALRGPNYLGQVPRSQVRDHFLSADVFVFPTLSDGFGLVVLEAMAAGLPVVCTRNCADLVQDGVNGFIVPPRDPEALADCVQRIVGDRRLRTRLSAAARETAQQYTIEAYGTNLAAAVREARH